MEAHHRDDVLAQLSTAKQASDTATAHASELHKTEISRLNESRIQLEESLQRLTSENAKIRADHETAHTTWKEEGVPPSPLIITPHPIITHIPLAPPLLPSMHATSVSME